MLDSHGGPDDLVMESTINQVKFKSNLFVTYTVYRYDLVIKYTALQYFISVYQ